jgi:hypothetical protein
MKKRSIAVVILAAAISATASLDAQNNVTEKAFVPGGRIELWLDSGDFSVKPSADNRIRVTLTGNVGNAKVEVTASGNQGKAVVRDSPQNNFSAIIEVPKTADLMIRMNAGDLKVGAIAGSKDVESTAGDVKIAVGDPNDYASVDASVKVGDLSASQFGGPKGEFLTKSVNWSGQGKYKLRARLGVGDLKLQ